MKQVHIAIYLASTRRTFQEDLSHHLHMNNSPFVAELISNSTNVEEDNSFPPKKKKISAVPDMVVFQVNQA